MKRLADKVAVVLGAAGRDNMGQAIARRFAEEGARVVVGGRHEAPLREIAAEIDGRFALCDITRKEDVRALARCATEAFGRIDVAVNCTGLGLIAKLLETTEEQIDRLMDLHFKGSYFFLQVFCEAMARGGGGSILLTSSASVRALLFHHAAYIGTKAGAEALARCFANEFGSRGVRINCIAPGLTATPMTSREVAMPGLEEAFVREYPLGRIGTVRDVADAALWLAGQECFMTGETLQVNGGLTLRRNPMPREINASLTAAAAGAAPAHPAGGSVPHRG
ncbi:MAG: SDR family oxidoreductase [Proteobacteria bacterium]|nr:SDR family oxidoreductase [Pseudomonadota bacterium]